MDNSNDINESLNFHPRQDEDPPQNLPQEYLPDSNLYLTSTVTFDRKKKETLKISLQTLDSLLTTTVGTNGPLMNISNDINVSLYPITPLPIMYKPNIAEFLGKIITGQEIGSKDLQTMMSCCKMYLDGLYEITPKGNFKVLNYRRDGTSRRYSDLCIAVYAAIGTTLFESISEEKAVEEIQGLIQDFYPDATFIGVTLNPTMINNHPFNISLVSVTHWATSIPWHSLIYNNRTPMDKSQFINLFLKIYALYGGKIINQNINQQGIGKCSGILPNSNLFDGRVDSEPSYTRSLSPLLPITFATLCNAISLPSGTITYDVDVDSSV